MKLCFEILLYLIWYVTYLPVSLRITRYLKRILQNYVTYTIPWTKTERYKRTRCRVQKPFWNELIRLWKVFWIVMAAINKNGDIHVFW